ncbi:SMP-30/gluconolactonase/LRE family protein [Roseateles toxinivorans]|uniref:Gluconolactonase n=1 Tax=Roseateles toxinivorans TaxID=270368 RepID=A0A4R6QUY8_9BURK|nr:SMP-30/gluconolactonase/LRE family protein [Roseateles toxinivorans]TDP75042.1 gluconolactonase [Roseateles toxinivorans]
MLEARLLCHTHDQVGESPLWSVAEQALFWVDIEGRAVRRLDAATGALRSWAVIERIGCIALHAEGGLIAAMETGIFRLELGDGPAAESTLLHAVSFPREGMRFNDGRCDRQGRFWVSSMLRDMAQASPVGALYCLDGQDLTQPIPDGLITGNGLGFAADGGSMWLSDSHPSVQKVWRFDIDAEGRPLERRLFVDMMDLPGRPDGAAVDVEGGYWICANDAGLVHRFMPDGRLDRSISLPVSKPSMCAFGGPALDRLFITSITPARPAPGFDAELDGAVFVCEPGVPGLAEIAFVPGRA